ncbi:MBOAT family protein [Leptolyngbya sp. FACHB-36]|uniref:MBOAT family O-acyltransferase n=1 Tax=Leptolyngbya sp. FACHB-36 TaxID=2692808 RepID=UPI001680B297|nr:MBOAT family protein [Leptolyngbya sp. FACHB-36]MBD2020006.1 MBOAT family protein [Leptolyngbya sp. FACHB-36]
MTFVSLIYALFLLSVFGIYWCVKQQWLRLWTLLIASIVFYTSLQVQYVPLLLAGAWMTFRLGQAIAVPPDWRVEDWQFAQQDWNRRRLKVLWLGIVLNLLLLLGFKYIPFLLSTIGGLFGWTVLQTSAEWTQNSLIAPLGLSFFCFECIAYLVDVYRGAPAAQQFLKFSAYKLFFPKLISGPITRYQTFATQLQTLKFPSVDRLAEGLWLIACGAIKKGLLADRLGVLVDLSFQNLQRAGSGDLWLATFAYGLQLYLDFSGYVDMARGSAVLLGFNLPQNFDFPYFSTSIADFWRRWHITLGDWLRNYLYFPLGGSRQGLFRTGLNLMIVMTIAGIWHGAAWGFIVWGVLHGIALVVHRLTDVMSDRLLRLKTFWRSVPGTVLAWILTQSMVFTSWIFFRLPNLKDSSLVVQRLWGHTADAQFAQKVYLEAIGLDPLQIALMLWTLVALMGVAYAIERTLKLQLNWHIKLLLVPSCLFAVWLFAPEGSLPYIYFDF